MRLCGISSRFQLLSPCTRQVTHALLTRPPLSHKIISPEGNQIKCFVRLACVKPVSYTHLDVYKRQHKASLYYFEHLFALYNICSGESSKNFWKNIVMVHKHKNHRYLKCIKILWFLFFNNYRNYSVAKNIVAFINRLYSD